jgi:N-acetylglutamate synthase
LERKILGCGLGVVEGEWVGLFDIYVDAEARRKGIGRAIVSAILEEAVKLGAESAYLQVIATNEPAKKLYQGFGFLGRYDYWYRKKTEWKAKSII